MSNSTAVNHYQMDEEETRGRSGYYDFHAPRPLTHDQRVSSYPSTIASSTASTASSSKSKRVASWLKAPVAKSTTPAKPKVNVHTTCGRHTDQLLFGGPSLTDLARSVFKKNK
ncbi:hypothetical protein NQ176_g10202 [Zarea fungicola]|uniref:Uncharacterized protein n=1 Tax=Zarea fungicola TaxID=93591 RepID=A0ACC1MHK2_9HYPO|nr:hypothetical protein NQ176_g10202 [Lecanicillium fungicola]